jgi:hypothetical protein
LILFILTMAFVSRRIWAGNDRIPPAPLVLLADHPG